MGQIENSYFQDTNSAVSKTIHRLLPQEPFQQLRHQNRFSHGPRLPAAIPHPQYARTLGILWQ